MSDLTFRPRCVVAAALLAAALVPLSAPAQKVVTRDELRVCMNSEADLAARRQALEARNRRNGEEVAAVRAEDDELKQERQRVEQQTLPMARDRFERKVKQHNARLEAARRQAEAFQADLEALNKDLHAHNDRCGGIAYRPEDKQAILKERDAAK